MIHYVQVKIFFLGSIMTEIVSYFTLQVEARFLKFCKIMKRNCKKRSVTLKGWTGVVRNPNVKVRDSSQLSPLTVIQIYRKHILLLLRVNYLH